MISTALTPSEAFDMLDAAGRLVVRTLDSPWTRDTPLSIEVVTSLVNLYADLVIACDLIAAVQAELDA